MRSKIFLPPDIMKPRIISLLSGLIKLFMILGIIYFISSACFFTLRTEHTMGAIIKNNVYKSYSGRNSSAYATMCDMTVEYMAGENKYIFTDRFQLLFSDSCHAVGDKIKVSFQANNPLNSSAETLFEIFFMPLFLIGLAILLWIIRFLVQLAKV